MAFLKNLFSKRAEPTKKPAARQSAEQADDAVRATGPDIAAPTNPILRSFHVSEKSARGMTMNQYTFIVDNKATKTQVRDAVRKSYKVDVVGVNMVRLPAKARSVGRRQGFVAGKRKAIVTIKAGQTIAAAQA
jgi:large subunit ribosomal protein L23